MTPRLATPRPDRRMERPAALVVVGALSFYVGRLIDRSEVRLGIAKMRSMSLSLLRRGIAVYSYYAST